jgi:hypothetical protein
MWNLRAIRIMPRGSAGGFSRAFGESKLHLGRRGIFSLLPKAWTDAMAFWARAACMSRPSSLLTTCTKETPPKRGGSSGVGHALSLPGWA